MSRLHFEIFIERPQETVFQLLADLPGYASWLPSSELYKGTITISERPIQLGTTYSSQEPSVKLRGEVTIFRPYSQLAFHQMAHYPQFLPDREVEMRIRYILQPEDDGTRVRRYVEVHAPGSFKVVPIVLLQAVRNESKRFLQRMKWYLEAR